MANPNDIQWDDAPAASTDIKWDDDTGIQWDDQPAKPRGFLEHLGGLWDRNAGALRQAAGGIVQAVGEAPQATANFFKNAVSAGTGLVQATHGPFGAMVGMGNAANEIDARERALNENPNAVTQVGRVVAEQGRDVAQAGTEASAVRRPGSVLSEPWQALKYYGNEAAGSAVPMAIAVAQPEVGLPLIGAQSFGQEYDDRRAKKGGVLESLASGGVHAAAEVIPEVASLGVLRGKIGSALTDLIGEKAAKAVATNVAARITGGAVAEGGSEVVTQLTQDLYDKFANGDDLTWEQIRERAKDAGITGAVMGGPLGAAHIAGEKALSGKEVAPKNGALESLLEPDKLDGSTVPSATPGELAKMAADRIGYLDSKEGRTAHETEELDLLRERQNDPAGLAEALGIELKPADEQLALPAPAPITVDSEGVARTPQQVDEEARAQQQATQERADLGLTPDVEKAQAARAASEEADAPNFGLPEAPRALPDDSELLKPHADDASPERVALREELVGQRFANAVPVPEGVRPIAYVMGGGGASGKGTVLKQLHADGVIPEGAVELDPDSFKTGDDKKGFGGIPEYWQIANAGDSRAAAVTHEESSQLYKQALARGMQGRYNLVLDRTLGDEAKGLKDVQALKDAGYEIRLVGVSVAPGEAVKRAVKRAQGKEKRYVPLKDLLTAHKGFSNAFEKYAELADKAELYDNTVGRGEAPVLMAHKPRGGSLEVSHAQRYNAFRGKGNLNENARTHRELAASLDAGSSAAAQAAPGADGARGLALGRVHEERQARGGNGEDRGAGAGRAGPLHRGADEGQGRQETVAPARRIATESIGASGTAYTGENEPVEFDYAVVDAGDLVTSNHPDGQVNAAYPQALQPRDRTSAESRASVSKIAKDLTPERLGASADIVNGAPLVGEDGVVESGNGRVMALQQAPAERQSAYRDWLRQNAGRFGLTPRQVAAHASPVLVRVRRGSMETAERVRLGREGNRGTTLAMNPVEQAKADARVIDDAMLAQFNPSDEGDVLAASNAGFLRSFAREIGGNETGGLSMDGRWTKQMADRVNAAIFQKAYGDDRLLALAAADADPVARGLVQALSIGAREFAVARSSGAAEAGLDMGPLLAEAAGAILDAKAKGQAVDEFVRQGDLTGSGVSTNAAAMAVWMARNARAYRAMGDALANLGKEVQAEIAARGTGDMFARTDRTSGDLIRENEERFTKRGRQAAQPGLFGAKPPVRQSGEQGEPGESGRGSSGRSAAAGTDDVGSRPAAAEPRTDASAEALRSELSSTSIGPALSALEQAGKLRIVHDPAAPFAGRWDGNTATLNAAHIQAGEGIGVALHELGVHRERGLRGILGDDLFSGLVKQLDDWESSPALGDRYEVAKAARSRAERDKDSPHYDEERLAYAVEEASRRVDAGKATGALREWLGRIMVRVRVWLSASAIGKAAAKAGAPIRPTAGDLVQLAKAAVLRQADTVESKTAEPEPVGTPKFSRPESIDAAGGERYVDKPAKPGETIRVFRVGTGESLGNKNAGNVDGILKMLAWNDDGESNLGMHPDSKLQVFEYTVPEKTDEYGHLMGGRVRGSAAGADEAHFGRGKAWKGDNESIWYSFGGGESAKARLVGEVPLTEVRADKKAQQGGDDLFAYTVNDHAWLTKYIADKFGAKFSRPAAALPAAAQSAMQKIGAGTTAVPWKQRLAKLTERLNTKLAQGLVDQFAPLADLDMTSYMQARLSKGTDGALEATFLHGMPKLQDGALAIEKDGKGLQGVLSDLDGEHDQFLAWIAGNRAANLKDEWIVKKDGKETRYRSQGEATIAAAKNGGKAEAAPRERLFTDPEIAGLKALNQGMMANGRSRAIAYAKAHEQFKAYQKAVLDIAEQAGLIDPASRATWESEFYVPFYRVMEDEKTGGVPASNAALVRQQAFKELRGGTNELQDLLANTLANWSHLLTASMRNMAATKAVDAAVAAGEARKVSGAQKGSVWIMRDGKQEHYEIDDDLVFDALNSLEYTGLKGPGMAAAKWFKHALTTGVTISPTFRVRNLLRDTLSVLAVSDSAGYNPLKNLVEGWSGTKHGSDTDVSLLAGGGKVRFGSLLDGNQAKNAKRLIEMGIKDQQILDTPEKIKNAFGKAWNWWKEVGDRSETINRAAVYQRAIAEGKTHLEASYEARDLLDFTMGGKWASVRFLTSVVPFMNARAQGLYKLGRAAKGNTKRFTAVTAAVAMASTLLYLLQRDDDDYKALPDWARDTYWCVKLGDKMLYIPKPFEIGALGTVMERATELAVAGNDYKAKDFAASLGSLLAGNLSMNPIPQVTKPLLEAAFNYDPFRGTSIDSMADERLVASQRYDANTSSAAIALSRLTGENGVSPKRIEHMLKGYFGWLGTQALNVSDLMSRAAVDRPASPKDDFSKIDNVLVAGDFLKDAKGGSSKYVERFYNLQKQLDQLYATATENSKRGNTQDAQDIMKRPELAKRPMIEAADKQVRAINAAIKQVRDDPKMPAGLKTRRLADLNEQRNKLLEQVDEAARR